MNVEDLRTALENVPGDTHIRVEVLCENWSHVVDSLELEYYGGCLYIMEGGDYFPTSRLE